MDLSIVFPMFWGREKKQVVQDGDYFYDHPSLADAVEKRAGEVLGKYASQAGVKLHYFSYSHLQRLHDYLRELGKEDLIETISLVGYSPLRNACLVAAHILNKDI